MKPADLNIYCWVIYAACSHSAERDPEPSHGVLCSLRDSKVLCSLPPRGASKWLSLATNFPLLCVKCCLNTSCRQVDAVSLLPVRSGKEIGENPISTGFATPVRFLFRDWHVIQLEKYLKFENTLRFAFPPLQNGSSNVERGDLASHIPKSLLYYPGNVQFRLGQQIVVTLNGKEAM